jgi:Glutathione S-transferase, C-terminal domain/Outer mitochondrial membrane transport complex protein
MSSSRSRVTARLYTSAGGWNLPTIDADGLSCHALLRFAKIPYSSVAGTHCTPADQPVIVLERASAHSGAPPETVFGLSGLIGLLASDPALPDPNPNLTPFMTAESTAFATLVSARFVPAKIYEFYMKHANYDDLWHNVLSRIEPFPLNRIVPFTSRQKLQRSFQMYGKSAAEAYFDAGIALAALATRLGERNKFFYGDKPSVLDAIVFGQLASCLMTPLPDAQLRSMIVAHGNLVQFVMRIKTELFPPDGEQGWGADLDADAVAEMRREAAISRAAEQRRELAREEAAKKRSVREASAAGSAEETEDERRIRHNWYFIYGTAAVFAGHLLFGNEIELELGGD